MPYENSRISVENTRFIFPTNFSGNPANDNFGDDRRKACLLIPDPDQAKDMMKAGIKIRTTHPRDGEEDGFLPEYFTTILLAYRDKSGEPKRWPPKVYLVTEGNEPRLLDEDTVGKIDRIGVSNVNVMLNPYNYSARNGGEGVSLYVTTMYVEQDMDDDPYAARYRERMEATGNLPF